MVVVIMGVSGSGKSTIGQLLADELRWLFFEGDDFHPPDNVAKMRAGIALNDTDRLPWLRVIQNRISDVTKRGLSAVFTCSALKTSYRNLLTRGEDEHLLIVYLKGDYDLIWQRMKVRQGHYMPIELLKSQFADLEEPEHAITIDIRQHPDVIIKKIKKALRG